MYVTCVVLRVLFVMHVHASVNFWMHENRKSSYDRAQFAKHAGGIMFVCLDTDR